MIMKPQQAQVHETDGDREALRSSDDDATRDGFPRRFALLVDREFCKRQHRLQRLINGAKLKIRPPASKTSGDDDRKLDRSFILELASQLHPARTQCRDRRTDRRRQVLHAQALGSRPCRRFEDRYIQLPDLLDELKMARIKGVE